MDSSLNQICQNYQAKLWTKHHYINIQVHVLIHCNSSVAIVDVSQNMLFYTLHLHFSIFIFIWICIIASKNLQTFTALRILNSSLGVKCFVVKSFTTWDWTSCVLLYFTKPCKLHFTYTGILILFPVGMIIL